MAPSDSRFHLQDQIKFQKIGAGRTPCRMKTRTIISPLVGYILQHVLDTIVFDDVVRPGKVLKGFSLLTMLRKT